MGTFLGVNIICVATAFLLRYIRQSVPQPTPTPSQLVYVVLAGLALVAAVLTFALILLRRGDYRKQKGDQETSARMAKVANSSPPPCRQSSIGLRH